ncbi:MAG: virion morphogenesis protein [Alphaproteobacteria bacterium HGW-Alphaproteobacteria-8]|nr:MAG: virion morphogenesis protein [Alphaproteobacteria bacterium HGW-Alphaproteobacteria-8]PKP71857.1 MAG: virion morphogenesis protein [Alphaproteobacteria bacterium HGW-Alphaproteobacteria-4]
MADLSASFRRPFAEQVAAFRLRLGTLAPTARWDDLWQSEHDRAFMVAGATKADLLADLGLAVDRAIAEGTSLETFRQDFRGIVEKHGWHAWTGEGTAKGEAWRTRVIYRTNMATSYAAGRHAQLVAGGFAFWVYKHSGAEHPRLDHLSWDGVVLEADHPFWAAHFPPNGWGCGCKVFGARSQDGAKRVGGKPGKDLPDNWNRIDPKTGAPVGIGKGWAYAPGASVADTVLALRGKLDVLPERPSIDLIQNWLTSDIFGAWLLAPRGAFPLVRISTDQAAAIGAEKLVADISVETALKQLREHPELSILEYAEAQRVVSEATRVIQDGPRALIFILDVPGANGHVLVVKATQTGKGLFVTSFRRLSRDQVLRDAELRRLLQRAEKGAGGGAPLPG